MLTFEGCLQQLLCHCVKRLDFILLSPGLPHDHPAAAALSEVGTNDSTWRGETAGEDSGVAHGARAPSSPGPRQDWPVLETGAPGQSMAFSGWLGARQAWLLVETGHQPGTCCSIKEPL